MSLPGVQNPSLSGEGAVWRIDDDGGAALATIGLLPGAFRTQLFEVNDAGLAVGTADFPSGVVPGSSPPVTR